MRVLLITLAALLGACGGGDGAGEPAPEPERKVTMVKPVVCVSTAPTSIVCN